MATTPAIHVLSAQDVPGGWVAAAEFLAAYHLQTESEKGRPVATAAQLPTQYLAEIRDPATAMAGSTVLLAMTGSTAVGCAVVTAVSGERCEVKRLWTDPRHRGHGIAASLMGAAAETARFAGAGVLHLSVWEWRRGAATLYRRLGFVDVDSWDGRDGLACMELDLGGSFLPGH